MLLLDESGDLGFDFSLAGTSKHLTIAFVSTSGVESLRRVVRATKEKFRIPREVELKGHNTALPIQKYLLQRLKALPIEIHAITAYKPNVQQHLRNDKNIFYNYVAGLILVPCACNLAQVVVVFDARQVGVKTGFDIDAYLVYKVNYEAGRPTAITARHVDSVRHAEMQAVDIITHAIFRKYESGDASLANIVANRIVEDRKLFFL